MKERTRLWLLAGVDITWTCICGILLILALRYEFPYLGPEGAVWVRASLALITASWAIRMVVNLSRIEDNKH